MRCKYKYWREYSTNLIPHTLVLVSAVSEQLQPETLGCAQLASLSSCSSADAAAAPAQRRFARRHDGTRAEALKAPRPLRPPRRHTANHNGSLNTIINNSYITQLPIVIQTPALDRMCPDGKQ